MSQTKLSDREKPVALVRALTAKDGLMIVIGSVIGSGIFLVPGFIAVQLGSLRAVLGVWLFGAVLTVCGALSLAEMGAMIPGPGGLYIYLRRAYGRGVAFLYGWGLLAMIQTGTIATLAAGFGLYLSRIIGLSPDAQKAADAGAVLVLTMLNLLGLRAAKRFQNVSTTAKIGGLIVFGALFFWRGHAVNLASSWNVATDWRNPLPFGLALIAVLWAYEGWHVVSFTAGEFEDPGRDLPASLIDGTLVVGAIYILLNLAYYAVLGSAQIRGTDSAAASATVAAFGSGATRFVSVLILVSILGAMNGMILTGPRVYYAMAREGDFLPAFGKLDRVFHAPSLAIVVQGVWAIALIQMGTFQQLLTHVVFTAWIFYGLAVGGVMVLRWRFPDLPRPFRTPGYPITPVLFVLAAGAVVLSTFASQPGNALAGIGLILLGVPVYFVFAFRRKPKVEFRAVTGEETRE
ncbi:MAG: amino acid permease [Terracidiphilus sp.]|jgi:APA family basic amino acid/polyamine antiporter